MLYELTDRFVVAADLAWTWAFFTAAENLPVITPPWLGFRVRTPSPIVIGRDTVIDYTIRWAGLPVRWRTLIIDWSPPHQFIDLQVRGPYALWHHQHRFEPADGGTICADRVIYRLPFGPLGRLAHAAIVRRQLLKIFRYRRTVIGRELGWKGALQEDVVVRGMGQNSQGRQF